MFDSNQDLTDNQNDCQIELKLKKIIGKKKFPNEPMIECNFDSRWHDLLGIKDNKTSIN